MNPTLSIIIPCYNCAPTLKEAVDSCYTQGFNDQEFEIILVDDGSADTTKEVMHMLKFEHANISVLFHEHNKGGGAARNTGIAASKGTAIFCLDSDDMLPAETLRKMYSYLKEHGCDGVTVHRSVKFSGNDVANIHHVDTSPYPGQKIPIDSYFASDNVFCPLVVTFMYTRAAFDKMGGYPTEHGADTQGFGWRFICSGLTVETCPETEYLHRIHFGASYYVREHGAGKMNYNWRTILLEHYYVFTPEALAFIEHFDCSDFTRDLLGELRQMKNVLRADVNDLLGRPHPPYQQTFPTPLYINKNSLHGYVLRIRNRLRKIKFLKILRGLRGKIYRYGYSLLIRPFTIEVSRSEFAAIHREMRDAYLAHKDTYDFQEFVMPEWRSNMLEIEQYFIDQFSFGFLNYPVIKKSMFMYTFRPWRDIQKKLIASTYSAAEARRILREYTAGKPLLNDFEYRTSGNSIHHLYHLLKFFKASNTSADQFNIVVEVGGGYGNMAKLFEKLAPNRTYIIIDIPIFSYIQATYLKAVLGREKVRIADGHSFRIEKGKINLVPLDKNIFSAVRANMPKADLFISTWALSESKKEMQDYIKGEDYFDATYLLLAYQKAARHFAFAEEVRHLPATYEKILSEETAYVKDNFYLFGKRRQNVAS